VARQTGEPYGPGPKKRYPDADFNQITGAQLIAEQWGLSRAALDEYSARSHELTAAAIDKGVFESQIVPVDVADGSFAVDEGLRRGTSVESLAKLKSVCENGTGFQLAVPLKFEIAVAESWADKA